MNTKSLLFAIAAISTTIIALFGIIATTILNYNASTTFFGCCIVAVSLFFMILFAVAIVLIDQRIDKWIDDRAEAFNFNSSAQVDKF